jgi:hypothetical protein
MFSFWDGAAIMTFALVGSILWHLGHYMAELIIQSFETYLTIKNEGEIACGKTWLK